MFWVYFLGSAVVTCVMGYCCYCGGKYDGIRSAKKEYEQIIKEMEKRIECRSILDSFFNHPDRQNRVQSWFENLQILNERMAVSVDKAKNLKKNQLNTEGTADFLYKEE